VCWTLGGILILACIADAKELHLTSAVAALVSGDCFCFVRMHRYLVGKGVKQATFTGHSWRHGLVVLMFMVAGMVSRRLPGSTEPLYSGPKKRGRAAEPERRQARRRTVEPGTSASECLDTEVAGASCVETDSTRSASSDSGGTTDDSYDDGASDAGTDGTMTGGKEATESAPVPDLEAHNAEYVAFFGEKATHDALLEVVCRAASIMKKLCGDNKEEGYVMSEADSNALSEEVFDFVTKYVRVLFGAINTTKFHALAYHLLSELRFRGNVIEADTSINEALHKLIKVMWQKSNKQGTSFVLQMLRCEQTLAHIIASDKFDKEQGGSGDNLSSGDGCAGGDVDASSGQHGRGDDGGAASLDESHAGAGEDDPQLSPRGATLDLLGVFNTLWDLDNPTTRGGVGEHGDVSEDLVEMEHDLTDDSDGEKDSESAGRELPVHRLRLDTGVQTGAGAGAGEAGVSHPDGAAASAGVPVSARRRRCRRVRISGRRVTVAQAAAADGGRLQQLPALLGVTGTSQLIVANTFKLEAVLPWRVRPVAQLVRAAADLYHKPWYDHVWYAVPGASPPVLRLGLARLLLRAVYGKQCDTVVLQCLEAADARPGCVLSEFNCRRLKWQIHPTTRFPVLLAVPLAHVRRLEHVVPDFEDLCERWGLMGTPTTVPDTPREREEQRFSTNPFFPWTSQSVADAP